MEAGNNWNGNSAEKFYSPEGLKSLGSEIQEAVLKRTSPQLKNILVPCGAVTGKFHCIKFGLQKSKFTV